MERAANLQELGFLLQFVWGSKQFLSEWLNFTI